MYLVMFTDSGRDAGWPITEKPLIVGRGDGCDVRMVEPSMSRRHFQVWMEQGKPHFMDLDSSNGTLLNGGPSHSAQLYEGDTLCVGKVLFRIQRALPKPRSDSANTPYAVKLTDSSYTKKPSDRQSKSSPRTVQELYDLYQLGRALGAVDTQEDLIATLHKALHTYFSPQAQWVVLCHGTETALRFHGEGPGQNGAPEVCKALVREAIESAEGMLAPGPPVSDKAPSFLVAPLIHGGEALGALVIERGLPDRAQAHGDLHFALGMAALVAPHVLAVQQLEQLRREHRALKAAARADEQLLGDHPLMVRVREALRRAAAATQLPVLLLGETGTGKEIAARRIHADSPRRQGPFVVINCAAIPGELFESELFGHERGAFTGASQRRVGRMEEAHGGTLFLDEIGDLAPDNQARILRAIETCAFHRVGGTNTIEVDVRFVAATNKALEEPAFRADLLHRLNGVTVQLPPLRARSSDIPLLARYFLEHANQAGSHPHVEGIAPEALMALQALPWPGNVRQLRAAILRATAFTQDTILTAEDFELLAVPVHEMNDQAVSNLDTVHTTPLISLEEAERRHIQAVLHACDGNVTAAAKILGIARGTIYKKLGEFSSSQ